MASTIRCPAVLGTSIPPSTPHAVSVSLPAWQDNVDYELGVKRVMDSLLTGYPRFFIHRDIQKLAELCWSIHAANEEEQCILFPSSQSANLCLQFLSEAAVRNSESQSNTSASDLKIGRLVNFPTVRLTDSPSLATKTLSTDVVQSSLILYAVFVPNPPTFRLAKTFWQHTGLGISSRCAERCLRLLGSCPRREEDLATKPSPTHPASFTAQSPPLTPARRFGSNGPRRHYSVKPSVNPLSAQSASTMSSEPLDEAASTYLEERYGRNLPIEQARLAKQALKRRIAGVLRDDESHQDGLPNDSIQSSDRGIGQLSESDVYLFPTGMSAIFYAHQICMNTRSLNAIDLKLRPAKSVCFGFPYTDTLKILEKWGPGAHFFGLGEESDLDRLEELLIQTQQQGQPPLTALFCEFPTNPLLKSPNLTRIRQLATQYGFFIVIDETVGNFLNVEVLPFADLVVSSLTKIFSGDSNVMGGSLVLNPLSQHYLTLKTILDGSDEKKGLYEDTYFDEDAIYMERNSRNFRSRVSKINHNASELCAYLNQLKATSPEIIKSIYYPKYINPVNFETCKRPSGGYGGLFSITFTTPLASQVFYDNLEVYKGPSLGTNFTLASPYVILAHFNELEWAEQFGVDQNLIRVSVGLEDLQVLIGWFQKAWEAACATVMTESG